MQKPLLGPTSKEQDFLTLLYLPFCIPLPIIKGYYFITYYISFVFFDGHLLIQLLYEQSARRVLIKTNKNMSALSEDNPLLIPDMLGYEVGQYLCSVVFLPEYSMLCTVFVPRLALLWLKTLSIAY